ncbi:DUF427 domain-containing protein [Caulobacter segnis]|uniref:Nucleotidyltransferase domain-containing protein n=1 Tax=Caulobacter segnis TaxID=88688 RepID=A0A2W5UXS7_9CAUL|nr:DUF427 domain-containing protein [Caulobacter segnis]PZR32470.1 MAG: nucleotidyltransferase domain-containing protein [Caulobacter segnis]
MKIPDETHPITIEPVPGTVRVIFEGHGIADSDDVFVLREANYPPVYYFPRDSVQMAFLRRTDKVTHCPYKGDASYFTIYRDRQIIDNAAWSYEDPYAAVGPIAARIAFYPEHVEFQLDDRSPAETEAMDVDEVVRHTDSGSGASQAEHWPANVDMPDPDKTERDLGAPLKDVGAI